MPACVGQVENAANHTIGFPRLQVNIEPEQILFSTIA